MNIRSPLFGAVMMTLLFLATPQGRADTWPINHKDYSLSCECKYYCKVNGCGAWPEIASAWTGSPHDEALIFPNFKEACKKACDAAAASKCDKGTLQNNGCRYFQHGNELK